METSRQLLDLEIWLHVRVIAQQKFLLVPSFIKKLLYTTNIQQRHQEPVKAFSRVTRSIFKTLQMLQIFSLAGTFFFLVLGDAHEFSHVTFWSTLQTDIGTNQTNLASRAACLRKRLRKHKKASEVQGVTSYESNSTHIQQGVSKLMGSVHLPLKRLIRYICVKKKRL